MSKVSISFVKNHLWLQSGSSELLITPEHIVELHKRHDKKEFAGYFLRQALLNRPARKLFQSWLRKDAQLWQKLYALIISLKFETNTTNTNADTEPTTSMGNAESVVIDVDADTSAGDTDEQDANKTEDQSNADK